MTDLYIVLSYLSGLYYIKPEMDPSTLLRTIAVIHLFDALLCYLIAVQRNWRRTLWGFLGFFLGIWALIPLFLIVDKRQRSHRFDQHP